MSVGTGGNSDPFAMAFSLGIELLNMRLRAKTAPVVLHHRFEGEPTAPETIQTKGLKG